MEGQQAAGPAAQAVRDPALPGENPRRLVTHEELLKQVWGGAVVSESAVRSHLHDLRQALGEGVIERSEPLAWIAEALARCAEPASNATDFVEARAVLATI